jgi:asparagine N-glycosylation enzyme membrane subunit Stt3
MRSGVVRRSVAAMSAIETIRRGAIWAHLGLALLVVAGVFAQVYLIGAYIFGAGSDALDAHTNVGFTVHGLEVLLFLIALVAWLPRADVGLSLLMALLGTTQIALADAHGWTGGLHPLGALLVLVLATAIVRRDLQRRRTPPA